MDNKKGFTLIEIIAVIVILGIIMLIAVPSVSSQIIMARKNSYSTNIKSYMETAQGSYVAKEYGNYLEDGELLIVPISRIKIEKGNTTNSPFGKYIQNQSYVIIKKSNKSQRSYINILDTSGYGVIGKEYDEVNRKIIEQQERDGIIDLKDYYQCENSSTFLKRSIPYYFQDVEYHACSEEAKIDCDQYTIPIIRMCQDKLCTITYNLNGGHTEVPNPTVYDDTTRNFILNEPVKDGYTFTGWTGSNGDVPQHNVVIGAESSCNKTYNANWGQGQYNINYDLDNGVPGASAPASGRYNDVITINNPSKTVTITYVNTTGATARGGDTSKTYTFTGWTSTTLGSNARTGTTPSPNTRWTGTSIKNIYFKNLRESGVVTMVANWDSVVATLPTLTKEGYTCRWTTPYNGGTRDIASGGTWTFASVTSRTFTAKCVIGSYTCAAGKYLKAGATSCTTCTSNHYCPGGTYDFNPTEDQGIFSCPSGYSSGTGKSQKSDCTISCDANKIVQIVDGKCTTNCADGFHSAAHTVNAGSTSPTCAANKYTVTFAGNGNTGGSMTDQTCTYNQNCTLKKNAFTKTGRTFSYWSFGSDHYNDQGTVFNLTTVNGGTVTLTANWNKNLYNCSAGNYLPKSTLGCRTCTKSHYCSGGQYYYDDDRDQGIETCPNGYSTTTTGNSLKSQCTISCAANKRVGSADALCNTSCPSGGYIHASHIVNAGSTSSACTCPTNFKDNGGTECYCNRWELTNKSEVSNQDGSLKSDWESLRKQKWAYYPQNSGTTCNKKTSGWIYTTARSYKPDEYDGGKAYYYIENSVMVVGWKKIKISDGNTYWYYFVDYDPDGNNIVDGAMTTNATVKYYVQNGVGHTVVCTSRVDCSTIPGTSYSIDGDGRCTNNNFQCDR